MKKKSNWVKKYFLIMIVALISLQLVLSFDQNVIDDPASYAVASISGLSGSGTSSSPYLINSGSDLVTLANHVNNGGATANTYFKLTKGIDVSGLNVQIGTLKSNGAVYYFDGIFDGNYCIITNFTAVNNSSTYTGNLGLFGYLRGTVKNLRLSGGSVTLTQDTKSAGAFAGSLYSGAVVQNCFNLGCNVTANELDNHSYIGGIVGYSNNGANITKCANYATVYNKSKVSAYAGGIVGYSGSNVTIKECFNNADITAGYSWTVKIFGFTITFSTSNSYVAGISATGGKISNCFNLGDITAVARTNTDTYYFGFAGSYKHDDKYYTYNYTGTYTENSYYNDDLIKREHIVYGKNSLFHVRILEAHDMHSRTVNSKNANAYGIAYNPSSISYCYNYGSYTGGYSGNSLYKFYGYLYDGASTNSSEFTITVNFYNNNRSGPISNKSGSYCYYVRDSDCDAYSTFSFTGANTSSGTYYYKNKTSVNKKIKVKLGGTTQYVRFTGNNRYYLYMYDEDYSDSTRKNFIQASNAGSGYKQYMSYESTPSTFVGTRYDSLAKLKTAVTGNFSRGGLTWKTDSKILNGYPYFTSIFWQDNAVSFIW